MAIFSADGGLLGGGLREAYRSTVLCHVRFCFMGAGACGPCMTGSTYLKVVRKYFVVNLCLFVTQARNVCLC